MPVRGTQGACPATAVSRRPRRQTAAAILVRGAGSMRTNGCRPRANCRCCRHICAGRPASGRGGGNVAAIFLQGKATCHLCEWH